MMRRSTIRLLLPVAAVLLAALFTYAAATWNEPLDVAERRLTESAVALQRAAGSPLEVLEEAAARNGYERVWMVDGSGRIVASSRPAEKGTSIVDPWAPLLMQATAASLFEAVEWGDRLMLFAAHRSAASGRWSVILEDGSPLRRERWTSMGIAGLAALALLLVIGFAIHTTIARQVLQPLEEMLALAEGVSNAEPAPSARIERAAARAASSVAQIGAVLDALWKERDALRRDLNERHALYLASTFLAREMVMVATFEGRVVEANRSFCERLGLPRSGFIGRPLAAFDGMLPVKALRELGERSAREKRPFERLLLTFSTYEGAKLEVVAAVQAVPFAGEPAFILVAGARRGPVESGVAAEPAGAMENDASREAERATASVDAGSVLGAKSGEALGAEPGEAVASEHGEAVGSEPGEAVASEHGEAVGSEPGEAVGSESGEMPGSEPGEALDSATRKALDSQPGEPSGHEAEPGDADGGAGDHSADEAMKKDDENGKI